MFWSPLFLPFASNVSFADKRKPWATIGLIALCVISFLALRLSQWHGHSLSSLTRVLFVQDDRMFDRFYLTFGLIPAQLGQLSLIEMIGKVVGSIFMHNGVMHIATNMFFLAAFGPSIERRLGTLPYLGFFLAGGILGNLLQIWSDPASDAVIMGASGAIASVFAAFLFWFPTSKIRTIIFFPVVNLPVPLPGTMPVWLFFVGAQVVQRLWAFWLTTAESMAATGRLLGPTPPSSIADYAHLGGFIFGLVVAGGFSVWARRQRAETGFESQVSYAAVKPIKPVLAYPLIAIALGIGFLVLNAQTHYAVKMISDARQGGGNVSGGNVADGNVADVFARSLKPDELRKAIATANKDLPGLIQTIEGQPQLVEPFKRVCKELSQSGKDFLKAQETASKSAMAAAARQYADAAAEGKSQFDLLLNGALGPQILEYISLEEKLGNYFSYKPEFSKPILPASADQENAEKLLLKSFDLIYPIRATVAEAGLIAERKINASGEAAAIEFLSERLKQLGHAPTCE